MMLGPLESQLQTLNNGQLKFYDALLYFVALHRILITYSGDTCYTYNFNT